MKIFIILFITSINFFAQQLNFPQDTLAYDDLFNNRQFTAIDADGKLHAVYSASQGTNSASREIFYLKESSGGTFSKINLSNNSVDDNYPTLSLLNGEISCVGFLGRDAANLFQVQYTDNIHGNFMQPVFITSGGLNKATPYTKVGPDSVVHFVFFTYTTGQDYVYYTKYFIKDSMMQLTPTTLTDAETGGDFDAALDVDNNGHVHIVVKSGSAFGGALKYYNDINGLQQITTTATGNVVQPKIVVDKNNFVHIIYRSETDTRLYYINNLSGTFSAPIPITPPGQRPSGYQNFSIDDSGNIFVIYQSSASTSGKGWYLVSAKNGQFSDSLLVYDFPAGYVTRNSSTVSSRGNGEIVVTYSPGAVRNSLTICDIFMKRGFLFGNRIISSSKNSVDFGNVLVGGMRIDSIFVHNSGSDTLKIDSLLMSDLVFMNTITPIVINTIIPPNDSTIIPVFFTPDTAKSYSGFMKIFSNATNVNPVTIILTGNGIGAATLSVDRDTIILNSSNLWSDSLIVSNIGQLPLTVDSITSSVHPLYQNLFHILPSNFILVPQNSFAVKIYFNIPVLELQGDFADSILIYSNDATQSVKKIILLYDSIPMNASEEKILTTDFRLHQNYPNPFNPSTKIKYSVPNVETGHPDKSGQVAPSLQVSLKVFDILGNEVATLVNEEKPAGEYEVEFDAASLSSGIYICSLMIGENSAAYKMVLMK